MRLLMFWMVRRPYTASTAAPSGCSPCDCFSGCSMLFPSVCLTCSTRFKPETLLTSLYARSHGYPQIVPPQLLGEDGDYCPWKLIFPQRFLQITRWQIQGIHLCTSFLSRLTLRPRTRQYGCHKSCPPYQHAAFHIAGMFYNKVVGWYISGRL